jgi:hypothetical protein
MIYNLIGSGILVAVGAGLIWAVMRSRVAFWRNVYESEHGLFIATHKAYWDARSTIARQTDLIGQLQDKRDRALACETPNAAHGVKKMAAILRGERP